MTEEQKATCAGADGAKSGLAGSIGVGTALGGPGWGVIGTTPGLIVPTAFPVVLGAVASAVYGLYRWFTD
jgi:hypothetical protein